MTRNTKDVNLIWKHTHKDFKAILDGVKCIMYIDPNTGGTTLGAIKSLPDSIYSDRMQAALKKEIL